MVSTGKFPFLGVTITSYLSWHLNTSIIVKKKKKISPSAFLLSEQTKEIHFKLAELLSLCYLNWSPPHFLQCGWKSDFMRLKSSEQHCPIYTYIVYVELQ